MGFVPGFPRALGEAGRHETVRLFTALAKATKGVSKKDVSQRPEDLGNTTLHNNGDDYYSKKRARAVPIHWPGINASLCFLSMVGIIENVFQAARTYAD